MTEDLIGSYNSLRLNLFPVLQGASKTFSWKAGNLRPSLTQALPRSSLGSKTVSAFAWRQQAHRSGSPLKWFVQAQNAQPYLHLALGALRPSFWGWRPLLRWVDSNIRAGQTQLVRTLQLFSDLCSTAGHVISQRFRWIASLVISNIFEMPRLNRGICPRSLGLWLSALEDMLLGCF